MKEKKFLIIIIVIAVLVITIAAILVKTLGNSYAASVINVQTQKETEVSLPNPILFNDAEEELNLHDLKGDKPMIINYFASWCPPCRMEMPHFDKAYQKYKDKINFVFVAGTDGQRETADTARDYIKQFSFRTHLDLALNVAHTFGIRAYPTTIIVSKEGMVNRIITGPMNEDTISRIAEGLLE